MPPSAGTPAFPAVWPLVGLLLLGIFVLIPAGPARAASVADGFAEEEISFKSGKTTLHATVLVPRSPGRKPAVALVHGAGPHTREDYRAEAEAFAREGLVTLVYDKRTEGYSQIDRSYGLLADDALAAAKALRARPDVNPEAVGLWGLSEGSWVVPLAANRPESRDRGVAFVVLVAASGVPPARQHSWNLENELRHQGVSGSMLRAIPRTGTRLLVGAGVFAEANHDPVRPLERLRQPVLALWGEKDRIQPPAESAQIVQQALRRGGNTRYAIRFFPDTEHGLRSSPDGFVVGEHLAPGYPETVASWVQEVSRSRAPGPSVAGPVPEQARPSRPLAPLAWWESGWAQLGATAMPLLAFASYPTVALGTALARLVRRRPLGAPATTPHRVVRLWARCLAFSGLTAVLGFVCYFGFLVFTAAGAVGPVIVGRPIPWLALQALAVVTCASTVWLGVSWWSARAKAKGADRARILVLLAGGAVFAAWAAYWSLLYP